MFEVLIVAKCNVNFSATVVNPPRQDVLIVAKCNVNADISI